MLVTFALVMLVTFTLVDSQIADAHMIDAGLEFQIMATFAGHDIKIRVLAYEALLGS